METFAFNLGTTLIFGAVFGFILLGACYLAEKLGLTDKLANLFNDKTDNE